MADTLARDIEGKDTGILHTKMAQRSDGLHGCYNIHLPKKFEDSILLFLVENRPVKTSGITINEIQREFVNFMDHDEEIKDASYETTPLIWFWAPLVLQSGNWIVSW